MEQMIVEKWDKAVDPMQLFRAVVRVYVFYDHAGMKPAAEKWTTNSEDRETMYIDVLRRWCRLTALDRQHFPYSVDFVVLTWITYRKTRDKQRINDMVNSKLEEIQKIDGGLKAAHEAS